ncbi:MAG TPA: dockerin type I domain-containing protein, partial [Oligoflexia bacterium]|nr:dockerin type I domain-containing protein [Oligoflexia bacterium]
MFLKFKISFFSVFFVIFFLGLIICDLFIFGRKSVIAADSAPPETHTPENFSHPQTPSIPDHCLVCKGNGYETRRGSICDLDADKDGKVNAEDARAVIGYLNQFGSQSVNSENKSLDTNKDGRVAASDALGVINYINA